jgi:integrase
MLWTDYARLYLNHCQANHKPRTFRNFDSPSVNAFVFDGRLEEVTPTFVLEWTHALRRTYSKTTVSMMFRVVRAAFNLAVTLGHIEKSPFDGLGVPEAEKAGRALSEKETWTIINQAREPLRSTAMFAVATGLRLGEILALRWEWITDDVAKFSRQNRKTKKPCSIPLSPLAYRAMGTPKTEGLVFPVSRNTIQKQLHALAIRLNMGRIRFHDLRHTHITEYLRHGDAKDLVEMGIHSTLTSTREYNHPPSELLKERVSKVFSGKEVAPPSSTQTVIIRIEVDNKVCARGDLNPQALSSIRTSSVLTWDCGEITG